MSNLFKRLDCWLDEMMAKHFYITMSVGMAIPVFLSVYLTMWLCDLGPWSPYANFL